MDSTVDVRAIGNSVTGTRMIMKETGINIDPSKSQIPWNKERGTHQCSSRFFFLLYVLDGPKPCVFIVLVCGVELRHCSEK